MHNRLLQYIYGHHITKVDENSSVKVCKESLKFAARKQPISCKSYRQTLLPSIYFDRGTDNLCIHFSIAPMIILRKLKKKIETGLIEDEDQYYAK